ncbi:glycosyltransferase [Clostridium sp. WLY-B-L2]|uniref:Glycosyltransferase n=1 Tax=Clostridium aromativorans TaxID=2836848 RepID=A0ABS8N320_9CLOT|nr:glycosyltransferase family 2 protein [Clostridium aromativorans]MCC9294201.1 glycosyltransferase [Clostridium aromativorans]
MSISLCMIVKNEEDVLIRCLESVKYIVDEIIIVDTGSTDSTVEIAKKYGARIFYYKWDDSFSSARNYSLEKATKEWILIMDADDEFEKKDSDKLLELVNNKNSQTYVYFLRTLSYSGDRPTFESVTMNLNVRLIKNGKGYKFVGDIHEQIVPPPNHTYHSQDVKVENIRFYHYGYLNEIIKNKNKRKRNMNLISRSLEQNSNNSFMLFNMGNEYYAMAQYKKALEYYMKSYKSFVPQEGFSSKLMLRIVSCNQVLKDYEVEYKFIDEGLKYYPNFTDLEFIRGNTLMGQGKYLAAIDSLNKCIKMGEPPVEINELVGVGSYRTYYVLSDIYFVLREYDRAMYYCDKVLKLNSGYMKAFSKLSQIMGAKKFTIDEMKEKFDSYLDGSEGENLYLFLSDVFYSQNRFDIAYDYTEKAERICEDKYNMSKIYYYKGICLFYQKKFNESYNLFRKIAERDFIDRAFYYSALCSTFNDSISTRDILIDNPKEIPDDKKYLVYMKFKDLLEGKKCTALAEDVKSSQKFLEPIFNLLSILLKMNYFEEFEKGLQLLNLIEDDNVLLYLAKLYYKNGYMDLAYKEFLRSIKIYDRIDVEGLEMMKQALYFNNSRC